jgi:hypothetical protein
MHLQISHLGIMENLTNVVDRALDALNPPRRGGGLAHLPPLVQDLRTLGHRDPKRSPGAGTRLGVHDSGWASGARTRLGVQDSGQALGARTQLSPYLLTPLRGLGLGLGTQNRLQEPPFALGVYVVLAAP